MRGLLAVMLGGALGAALRYGVALGLAAAAARFPWHTLAVNLVGSFVMGLLIASALRDTARLFLLTGVLGGFTTFSAFSIETLALVQDGRLWAAAAYVALSVLGGVLFAFAGVVVGR